MSETLLIAGSRWHELWFLVLFAASALVMLTGVFLLGASLAGWVPRARRTHERP